MYIVSGNTGAVHISSEPQSILITGMGEVLWPLMPWSDQCFRSLLTTNYQAYPQNRQ